MTNGEALEQIKKDFYFDEEGLEKFPESRDCKCAIDLAMVALEKQIPKPVVRSAGYSCHSITQNIENCYCPVCNYSVDINLEEQYCPICGQALDWEDEEDV